MIMHYIIAFLFYYYHLSFIISSYDALFAPRGDRWCFCVEFCSFSASKHGHLQLPKHLENSDTCLPTTPSFTPRSRILQRPKCGKVWLAHRTTLTPQAFSSLKGTSTPACCGISPGLARPPMYHLIIQPRGIALLRLLELLQADNGVGAATR